MVDLGWFFFGGGIGINLTITVDWFGPGLIQEIYAWPLTVLLVPVLIGCERQNSTSSVQ